MLGIRALLAGLVAVGAVGLGPFDIAAPAAAQSGAGAPGSRGALPQSFADIAERLAPGVVNISTTQALPDRQTAQSAPDIPQLPPGSPFEDFFRDFFGERGAGRAGPRPRAQSLGSGFIVDAAGFIVTNNHVVADAEEITVTLQDDTVLKAQIVGRDAVTDIALLKVESKDKLTALAWGDAAKTRVGDWVLTIGNPYGLGGSVTAGIVSARARDIHAGPYDDFLQTDAPINRGNSGGPMFNLAGEIIGITTAIYSPSGGSVGIGFAIPASLARPIVEQLKTKGRVERGWLGVRIQAVTDEVAESLGLEKPRGALVSDVDPSGPAAKAKVQAGDIVLSYDGKPIDRTRALPRMVADTLPDKSVKLTLWRDGKEITTEAKIAALTPELAAAAAAPPKEEPRKDLKTVDILGLSLARVTPELRQEFELDDTAKGIVVVDLDDASMAAQRGIKAGDLISALGREAVETPEQLAEKVEAARKAGRKSVLLRIDRDGAAQFVPLPTN